MFEWGMNRLVPSLTSKRSKGVLFFLQNPAGYYCCTAIKRCGQTFPQDQRNVKASESYENFVVWGLSVWMDEHDYHLLKWLMREVVGRPTLNGEFHKCCM